MWTVSDFYPSYISYLRSWIGDHSGGSSQALGKRKPEANGESGGNSPVHSKSPKLVRTRNSSPIRKSAKSRKKSQRREWLLFLPACRVQMTTSNVELHGNDKHGF